MEACAAADATWSSRTACPAGGRRAPAGRDRRAREPEPETTRRTSAAKACHILHIDDDEDDRALFAMAFAKSGLDGVLHSLGGAADALLHLNQLGPHVGAARPKLIILDLSLPRLDGRELLELLKTNPASNRSRSSS